MGFGIHQIISEFSESIRELLGFGVHEDVPLLEPSRELPGTLAVFLTDSGEPSGEEDGRDNMP